MSMDFNCQAVMNPLSDVPKYLGSAGNNYGRYDDPVLEHIYAKMIRSTDTAAQCWLMRQYERRVPDEQAHMGIALWWYKVNPYRSYVKRWKIAPSHYLNQHLDDIRLGVD